MNPPLRLSPRLTALLGFTSLLASASTSPAQTANAPAAGRDETVQLIPFEVSAKRAPAPYVQDEVVSVTKFAVPLIDVPQNIFVFTRELLEDMSVGEMRYALAYNASLQGGPFSVGGSYRGFSNQEKLKDGFKMSAFFDYPPAHFERIELLKGPSAVMYGRTEPGGITNYVTKRPIPGRTFATFKLGIGKNNKQTRQHYEFDLNQSFTAPGAKTIDVRITGAHQEFEDMVSGSTANGKSPQDSIRIAATTWLTPQTRLYVNYLYYERLYHTQFGRYAAFAVTVPQTTPGHSLPFALAYGRDPFEDYGRGREFSWQYNDTQAILDHKFSNTLDFRFGFNLHKRTKEDYLLVVAADTTRPGNIVQTNINKDKSDAWFPDAQANVIWKPAPGHNVLVGYSHNWFFTDDKVWNQQRNGDGTPFRRSYNPAQGIPGALPGDVAYINTAVNRTERAYGSWIANYHGAFADGRLQLMAGIAHNRVEESYPRTPTRPNPPRDFNTTDTNPQIGAVYKLTPNYALFALASQSTQFSITQNSFGEYFGPVTGDGLEGGLKFQLAQNRVHGTLTYYYTEQSDVIVFDPLAESLAFRQSVQAGAPNPALRGDQVPGGTTSSEGFELDVSGAITPQWNVTFSYAHNDQKLKENPNPVLRGTRVVNNEPNRVGLWTRYDFAGDAAKGLFVGGGVVWFDKAYAGFAPASNNTRTYWRDGTTRLDVILGYRFRALGRDQQIKLSGFGINQPRSFTAGYNPAVNDFYYLKSKPIWYLDYQITF